MAGMRALADDRRSRANLNFRELPDVKYLEPACSGKNDQESKYCAKRKEKPPD
jgi:hypothetical protein